MRALLRLLLRCLFRFRAYNAEVLQTPGPVLLIPNHVTWIDWLFLYTLLELDWKFVVSSIAADYSWLHGKIMRNRRTFPVDPASPYAVKRLAEHLEGGGRLVLFAEGQITYTGSLMKLYEGTGFLLLKTPAKIVTCYLRGGNRLRWSRQPGWKRLFPRVTVHFSSVLHPPAVEQLSGTQARARLTLWLRDQMVNQQFETDMAFGPQDPLAAIIDTARVQPQKVALQDFTFKELTYRRLLVGADLLAARLERLLAPDVERVGVLLPNVNATPVVVLSLWALGRAPAIMNFSTGVTTMTTCAGLAKLRQVITSRSFLTRAKLQVQPLVDAGIEFVYLEDVREGISRWRKLASLILITLAPGTLRRPGPPMPGTASSPSGADKAAVILFTSGSEGVPKGVELSHRNLLANIRQMLSVTDIEDRDRLFNALPLFHSFGLVVGTLLPLVRGLFVFLYPSPLHYRLVPAMLYDRQCTIFLSTNTFLNGYARKAQPYDFRSMRYLFAAAEKVQEATAMTWARQFGVRLLEGYGATECSPCVSVNVPMTPRHGSAGRFLPGIEHRLEPVEGVSHGGRLFVRGPNVMTGYLNPDAQAKFKELGGWYDTGDIADVDADGFLFILGRLKRFAKVSGEMVSLTAVEEALAGAFPHYGTRCQVAVVTRPDPAKGEALIAVTNEAKLGLDEIRAVIQAKGLTNLCVPREVKYLREIPKLGTGKVNHRELAAALG